MNNPIHTCTKELDITFCGVTKTHDVVVTYTYTEAIPVFCMDGLPIDTAVPAQVEIHDIKVIVNFGGNGTKTEYKVPMECKCLSPEHEEALKERILEDLE